MVNYYESWALTLAGAIAIKSMSSLLNIEINFGRAKVLLHTYMTLPYLFILGECFIQIIKIHHCHIDCYFWKKFIPNVYFF